MNDKILMMKVLQCLLTLEASKLGMRDGFRTQIQDLYRELDQRIKDLESEQEEPF